ncbi:hypothetical protein LPJ70_007202 [Coemansia sp. RSA 2708]|nr:hypothetical protein LPJ70_007202 [Coemansia sp. RSA 2708]
MTLASCINWVQATISHYALNSSYALVQYYGFAPTWAGDFVFGFLNKFDVTCPSASSRIDRMVLESRAQSEHNAVRNEEKLAIVTGANCGIGFETAKALGRAGFHVVMGCRNVKLGTEAVLRLERQTGLTGRFELVHLDLASLESVDAFVKNVRARGTPVDVLVNNAGVMACPAAKTRDAIELQFGTNHVGHFALTMGLVDQLKQAKDGARVVVVSSIAAFLQRSISYAQIEQAQLYHRWQNYGISKLANLLFATALARRLEGSGVAVNALHPGTIATGLHRHVSSSSLGLLVQNAVLDSAPTGALTSIYLALSPEVQGVSGQLYARSLPREMHPIGYDVQAQDELWAYTKKLIADRRAQ